MVTLKGAPNGANELKRCKFVMDPLFWRSERRLLLPYNQFHLLSLNLNPAWIHRTRADCLKLWNYRFCAAGIRRLKYFIGGARQGCLKSCRAGAKPKTQNLEPFAGLLKFLRGQGRWLWLFPGRGEPVQASLSAEIGATKVFRLTSCLKLYPNNVSESKFIAPVWRQSSQTFAININ